MKFIFSKAASFYVLKFKFAKKCSPEERRLWAAGVGYRVD